MADLAPGQIRLRGVSRSFRILHDRNLTLKETALRRRRTHSTQLWAVRDVDLDVQPGESVGLIGQNGSGKSTLLKMLAGIIPPHEGTVEIGGTVASMLELGSGFHPDFTGRENVYMNASIHGLSERQVDERLDDILAFSEIGEFIDMPVRTYSSGMSMRLAFSIASHVEPDVLLLDEVLAVGDEAFQRKCFGRIFEFRRRGGTLVFVSHDPGAVERVCDRALLLADGTVRTDGPTPDTLAIYHRRLASEGSAADAAAEDDDERQWGDREVEITASRLVGVDGPTDRFYSGDPLTIEMDVTPRRPVETPIFGIGIHAVDGPLLYGTNTRLDQLDIRILDGPATVRFTIPSLPLNDGRFTVQLAVVSSDESVVHHWLERWLEFSVFARASGVGPIALSGSWELRAAVAEDPTGATLHAGSGGDAL
jgi:ABC-type polysaccharide/polyol phosphate transport system ATPase subunit